MAQAPQTDALPPGHKTCAGARHVPTGTGTANGTFGELLQGALPGDDSDAARFLVTLPVTYWSVARFSSCPVLDEVGAGPGVRTKSATLAGRLLREIGAPPGGHLQLSGDIPIGKGLASSSADMVATARAVTAAWGTVLPNDRLGELMAQIEPTDGVQHHGVVAYHHRTGQLLTPLGHLPSLCLVALDEGGHLDTIAFNRRPLTFDGALRAEYAELLDGLGRAVAATDLRTVGRIATRSAELNQRLVPRRYFTAMHRISAQSDALGLVACHSGTMIAVLLDPAQPGHTTRLPSVVRQVRSLGERVRIIRTMPADIAAVRDD